jgi:hypothetical protein
MTHDRTPLPVVASMLAERIETMAAALGLPVHDGDRHGDRLVVLNTIRGEKNKGSLNIYIGGRKQGGWVDYVDPGSLKGDALALAAYCLTGDPRNWRAAQEWALRWLGLAGDLSPDDRAVRAQGLARQAEIARQARERAAARDEDQTGRELKRLKARWLKAAPLTPDTVGWTYLARARRIDLEGLAAREALPSAVRTEAQAFHSWKPDDPGPQCPTLIAQLLHRDRGFVGVHITFLAADGSAKTDLTPPRKMRPRGFEGAAIPVARGASGKSVADALKAAKGERTETVAVCEGLEDALTLAVHYPDLRIYAAGTVGQLAAFAPPPTCATLILVADNDHPMSDAARAFTRAKTAQATRAGAEGFRLKIWRAIGAKDVNGLVTPASGDPS